MSAETKIYLIKYFSEYIDCIYNISKDFVEIDDDLSLLQIMEI